LDGDTLTSDQVIAKMRQNETQEKRPRGRPKQTGRKSTKRTTTATPYDRETSEFEVETTDEEWKYLSKFGRLLTVACLKPTAPYFFLDTRIHLLQWTMAFSQRYRSISYDATQRLQKKEKFQFPKSRCLYHEWIAKLSSESKH
jgi:hypothetical protein